jgi:hypothetical protein
MTAPEPGQDGVTLDPGDRAYLEVLTDRLHDSRERLSALRNDTRDHGVARELDVMIQLVSEAHDRTSALLAWLRRNLPPSEQAAEASRSKS